MARDIIRINQQELDIGLHGGMSASWHAPYKSAYVYVGGLDSSLTEGDVIAVFSQFGEVVDCHLRRDPKTGKPLGFGFVAYEDQKSTILAIDNFNGTTLLKRMLKVDHAESYTRPRKRKPKEGEEEKGIDSSDEDYDERRKAIWDYEAYADPIDALEKNAGAGSSSSFDPDAETDQRTKKIMDLLQQRKRKRAMDTAQEGPQMGKGAVQQGIGEGKANVWSTDVPASVAAAKVRALQNQVSRAFPDAAKIETREEIDPRILAQRNAYLAEQTKKEKKAKKDKKTKKSKEEKQAKKDLKKALKKAKKHSRSKDEESDSRERNYSHKRDKEKHGVKKRKDRSRSRSGGR